MYNNLYDYNFRNDLANIIVTVEIAKSKVCSS